MNFALEGLQIQMNKFRQISSISDEDFMIHILNILPDIYNVILIGLENHLVVTGDDALTIDAICKKLNHHYKKLKTKRKKKLKRKGLRSQ